MRCNIDRIAQTSTNKNNKILDTVALAIDRQTEVQLKKNSILLLTLTTLLEIVLIILNDHFLNYF